MHERTGIGRHDGDRTSQMVHLHFAQGIGGVPAFGTSASIRASSSASKIDVVQ